MHKASAWIALAGLLFLSGLAADNPPRGSARSERPQASPLRTTTVTSAPSPHSVVAPASFSLNIEEHVELGGFVFKDGTPFIHNDGGASYGNTAVGLGALISVTPGNPVASLSGARNTAFGHGALRNNTSGFRNTASGYSALYTNTTGTRNTAGGDGALFSNTSGYHNTATGYRTLYSNTDGYFNTASGVGALESNTTGSRNTANGYYSLLKNVDGTTNTAVGGFAMYGNTSGSFNTAVGPSAGWMWTTGNYNIAIGVGASGVEAESGVIRIGGYDIQTHTYIEGISDDTILEGTPVCVSSSDELGMCVAPLAVQGAGVSPVLLAEIRRLQAELTTLRRRLERLERGR